MRPTPGQMPALHRLAACRPPIALKHGRPDACLITHISSGTCDAMYRCRDRSGADVQILRRFEDGSVRQWSHHDPQAGRWRRNRAPKGSRWLSVPILWADDAIAGTLPPDDDGGPPTDEAMARLRAAIEAFGR